MLEQARSVLTARTITTSQLTNLGVNVSQDGSKKTAYQLIGLPNFGIEETKKIFPEIDDLDTKALNYMYIESKYSSYLKRQDMDIKLFKDEENYKIPEDLDYLSIHSLSNEIREKLSFHKPSTLGAARRISGVTPAALTAVLIYLKTNYVEQ